MDWDALLDPLGIAPTTLGLYAALVGAGVAAGFINTMAGGGSLLTLPALMLLGLPANVANGTNRLAVVTQSLSGALAFHRAGKLHTEAALPVAAPTIAGAVCGATAAAWTPVAYLEPILLGTLVVMALLMVVRPRAVLADPGEEPRHPWKSARALLGLFGAGLYGGYVQAGVGFVLLAVLGGALRYDAVRANALKLVCTLLFGVAALAVYVAAGQVRWVPAAVLAVGTVVGAQLGVRFAVKAKAKVLRAIIFVLVVASCVAAWLKP
ncbi:MAG TPA: sulfite exporter TauE/SafE family protein [Sandaracinaceae bacterium LLY-WYZ-13_1]|nr:sulfite exporter TauE/SafE family protein [Sandaracinaceae bacterium LLY-WYZ-13_1]